MGEKNGSQIMVPAEAWCESELIFIRIVVSCP